ncbi:MAG: alpha/beta hydrolase family protein [Planctomycetota bacterium]|jgi:pimeloyl-ACP methyl ester carboxylesterase
MAILAGLLSLGCSLQECSPHPRPALPIPDSLARQYELPGEVREDSLVPIGSEDGVQFFRGRLSAGSEEAEFHFLRPENPNAEARPFVLCLPILAGGKGLMWALALEFARRGYNVAWMERITRALRPGQRGPELEDLLRRTVLHNRMILTWARQQEEVDADRSALLGVSLGGMVGSTVLALEPELRAGVLCLAGADLPEIIIKSEESRVISWRRWRDRRDGMGRVELLRELDRNIASEPSRLGAFVDSRKTFLVASLLDEVVPMHNQDLLWESLGRPQRLLLPLSHYSAALAISGILDAAHEFMEEKFAQPVEKARPPW